MGKGEKDRVHSSSHQSPGSGILPKSHLLDTIIAVEARRGEGVRHRLVSPSHTLVRDWGQLLFPPSFLTKRLHIECVCMSGAVVV